MGKFNVLEQSFHDRKITKIQVHEQSMGYAGFLTAMGAKHCYSIVHLEGNQKIIVQAQRSNQPQGSYLIKVKPFNDQKHKQKSIGKIFQQTLTNTYKTLKDIGKKLKLNFHNKQYSLNSLNCYYVCIHILEQLQLNHLKTNLEQHFDSARTQVVVKTTGLGTAILSGLGLLAYAIFGTGSGQKGSNKKEANQQKSYSYA